MLVKLVIVEDYFIEIRGIYVTELKVRYIHIYNIRSWNNLKEKKERKGEGGGTMSV